MDKELEKKFMRAMTERLNDYEEGFKTGKIHNCNICEVFRHKPMHQCEICPLNGMNKGKPLHGCFTPARNNINSREENNPDDLKSRYKELIKFLDKIGYGYK